MRRERRDNPEQPDQLEDEDDPETTDPKETLYDADTQTYDFNDVFTDFHPGGIHG